MDLDIEFRDPHLQTLLHVGHRPVVDKRGDLLEEIGQQPASRDVADALFEVLAKIAFDRFDRLLARRLRE